MKTFSVCLPAALIAQIIAPTLRLAITAVQHDETRLIISTATTNPPASCPTCHTASRAIHSHYQRQIAAAPWGQTAVLLHLTVRRFRCRVVACRQQVFTERLPTFVAPWARMTIHRRTLLRQIAFAAGGEAGSRLCAHLHRATSPATLITIIRQTAITAPTISRIIGVDDWALRKRVSYGTIIVDLERRQPIDLLPGRTAAPLTAGCLSIR